MKTPSQYPVLDNRPIDQWKVTELKEELKRRKLMTKGLKDDLVKRLDEALRMDRENAEEEVDNGIDVPQSEIANEATESEVPVDETGNAGKVFPVVSEEIIDDFDGNASVDVVSVQEDVKDTVEHVSQVENAEEKGLEMINDQPVNMDMLFATDAPFAVVDDKVCESLSSGTVMGELGLQVDKMDGDVEDLSAQQGSEDVKPSHVDTKLNICDPTYQVSEVSTNLGFHVKSNYVSNDSVSINEKNELEDNIIADNDVKLEPDVKPEMVQPSSSNLVPDGGESHLKDVEEPHETKVSVQETDNNVTNAEMSQKNQSADLAASEKLNLDRSSGDESMEEDALECKQIDSNCNSKEVNQTEKNEVTNMEEGGSFAAMDTDSHAEEKSIPKNKDVVAASFDKRKLPEQEATLHNEPSKRQRRWKTENNKAIEPQISNIPAAAAANDVPEPAVLKRSFSRSDSAVANYTATKEREVPPSAKPATNSLRVDRFLRPFTLKAVQELLAKTGTVTSFWMDHIKTHCYVTYSSVEEAVETRNAVYNLQWPPNGGRNLLAEFVDSEEVKLRVEAPSLPPAAPVTTGPTNAPEPPSLPQPSPRLLNLKQRLSQQPTPPPPPPPPLSKPTLAREWTQPLPPPPEKIEASIVTLDDLFRKTKATPRIYYLPLSEEQVSAKLEERRKNAGSRNQGGVRMLQ